MTHREQMKLLRRAGREQVQKCLPSHTTMQYSDHSTGFQVTLSAVSPEKPALPIWVGSIWDSSQYDFNDDKKVLGIQHGCEFAAPAIDDFFSKVQASVEHTESVRRAQEKEKARADEQSHAELIKHYEGIFSA